MLTKFLPELAAVFHATESILNPKPWRVGQHQVGGLLPGPFALEGITDLNASVKERFHFFPCDLTGGFRAKTDQFMANAFEQQPCFGAFHGQRTDIEELDIGKQPPSVGFLDLWIGVLVSVCVSTNQSGMEESTAGGGVGDGERDTAHGSKTFFHSPALGFVIDFVAGSGFGDVELGDVLPKSGRQIAHQKVGLLDGFLRIHQVVLQLRSDDGIGQPWWRWVSATG